MSCRAWGAQCFALQLPWQSGHAFLATEPASGNPHMRPSRGLPSLPLTMCERIPTACVCHRPGLAAVRGCLYPRWPPVASVAPHHILVLPLLLLLIQLQLLLLPGMMGLSGKWPVKKLSLMVTHL